MKYPYENTSILNFLLHNVTRTCTHVDVKYYLFPHVIHVYLLFFFYMYSDFS